MTKIVATVTAVAFCLLLSGLGVGAARADTSTPQITMRTDMEPDPALAPLLRQAGIEWTVVPGEESDWAQVSKFNLWLIIDWSPEKVNPEVLDRFLKAGGGVFCTIHGSDTVTNIQSRWNALLKPYGVQAVTEQVIDQDHSWREPAWGLVWAWTSNFADSPITQGLSSVWYPNHTENRQGHKLGNWHLVLDDTWQKVVRTMPSGGAYVLAPDGAPDFQKRTEAAPALLATRQVGAGRLAVQSYPGFYNYSGGSTLMVSNVTLSAGDGTRKSDGAQLLVNTLRWLAEPSLQSGALGGYQPEKPLPEKPWPGPAQTLTQWEWMRPRVARVDEAFPERLHHFRGLLGAHTALSTGTGTVAEQSTAAQAAGYDFVIFTETLGAMNPQKWAQLTAQCQAVSTDKFLAVPGLDVLVHPWSSEKTPPWNYLIFNFKNFPDPGFLSADGSAFARQFDNWYFANGCPGVAVHSQGKRGLPGWFYCFYNCFSLFTYRSGVLVDDSEQQFQRVVDGGACLYPVVTHLSYSVEDIRKARQAPYQLYVNVERNGLLYSGIAPGRWEVSPQPRPQVGIETPEGYAAALRLVPQLLQFGPHIDRGFRNPQPAFVSSGPMLEEYALVGGYPFDLQHDDRMRLVVGVSSDRGLRRISAWDGQRPYEEWAVAGPHARVAAEDYVSKYWHFVVKAEDVAGGRMISSMVKTGSWHMFAQMCTDQQNIIALGPLYFKGHATLVHFPDTPPNQVRFWAGEGDDGPNGKDWNSYLTGDVDEKGGLRDGNMYAPPEFHLDLASAFETIVAADELWSGGRGQEGMTPADPVALRLRTYDFLPAVPGCDGSFSRNFPDYWAPHPPRLIWGLVEGEAELTRDVAPSQTALVNLRVLGADGPSGGSCAYLPPGATDLVTATRPADGWKLEGKLAPDGMLAIGPMLMGGFCLYPLTPGMCFSLQGNWELHVGYHLDGPAKKGQKYPVRFLLARGLPGATFEQNLEAYQDLANNFGLTGARPFYTLTARQGTVTSSVGLLELQARDYGFLGDLVGADQVRDVVGIRLHGLNPHWDAGAYSPQRKWLRRLSFDGDTAYTSLDQTEPEATVYYGNLLVCDNGALNLRLIDAQGKWCRFIAHNSTGKIITATVRPAGGFRQVYPIPDFSRQVAVPAGTTVTVDVGGSQPAEAWQKTYDGQDAVATTGVMIAGDAGAQAVQVREARAGMDKPGWLITDQWAQDEPSGPLEAHFRLKVAQAGGEEEVARIQVTDRTRDRILVTRTLKGADFTQAGVYLDFVLPFDRPATGAVDYTIYWTGQRDLFFDTILVRPRRSL
jgi:hypothetical protein